MNQDYLKTPRVRLRQFGDGDLDLLLDLNNDPEVMRYLTGGVPGTREEAVGGLERTLLYQRKFEGTMGVFKAEHIESSEFMGWFHLRPAKSDLDNTKVLELGYRLKRKFWRMGYATEVSRELIAKAFTELRAECVFAQTLVNNLASRRVMEKVGLCFEREFVDSEHLHLGPAVRYQLLREDWKQLGR